MDKQQQMKNFVIRLTIKDRVWYVAPLKDSLGCIDNLNMAQQFSSQQDAEMVARYMDMPDTNWEVVSTD